MKTVTIEYLDLNGGHRRERRSCKDPKAVKEFKRSIIKKGGVIEQVFG